MEPRVKKERKPSLRVGQCFQWKTHVQRFKGDSCSFSHDNIAFGDSGGGQRQKRTIVFSHTKFEEETRLTVRDKNPAKNQK